MGKLKMNDRLRLPLWGQVMGFIDSLRTTGGDKFSDKTALFDCRCFNVPMNEVLNYLIWRQQDWERNSVQMIAQVNYSHNELQGKSCKQLITLLEEEKGIVWGQLPTNQKRGEFWVRGEGLVNCPLFKEARGRLEEELLSNI